MLVFMTRDNASSTKVVGYVSGRWSLKWWSHCRTVSIPCGVSMLEYIEVASTVKRRAPCGRPCGNRLCSLLCRSSESLRYVGRCCRTSDFSLWSIHFENISGRLITQLMTGLNLSGPFLCTLGVP